MASKKILAAHEDVKGDIEDIGYAHEGVKGRQYIAAFIFSVCAQRYEKRLRHICRRHSPFLPPFFHCYHLLVPLYIVFRCTDSIIILYHAVIKPDTVQYAAPDVT